MPTAAGRRRGPETSRTLRELAEAFVQRARALGTDDAALRAAVESAMGAPPAG